MILTGSQTPHRSSPAIGRLFRPLLVAFALALFVTAFSQSQVTEGPTIFRAGSPRPGPGVTPGESLTPIIIRDVDVTDALVAADFTFEAPFGPGAVQRFVVVGVWVDNEA